MTSLPSHSSGGGRPPPSRGPSRVGPPPLAFPLGGGPWFAARFGSSASDRWTLVSGLYRSPRRSSSAPFASVRRTYARPCRPRSPQGGTPPLRPVGGGAAVGSRLAVRGRRVFVSPGRTWLSSAYG